MNISRYKSRVLARDLIGIVIVLIGNPFIMIRRECSAVASYILKIVPSSLSLTVYSNVRYDVKRQKRSAFNPKRAKTQNITVGEKQHNSIYFRRMNVDYCSSSSLDASPHIMFQSQHAQAFHSVQRGSWHSFAPIHSRMEIKSKFTSHRRTMACSHLVEM